MRYILKNYQESAVADLTSQLAYSAQEYRRTAGEKNPIRSAVSLAAVTGAGKTVMAAATIESVLKGTPSTPADPTAVFLWVSDSPDLNKQSRYRIEAALGAGSMIPTVTVTPDFREYRLSPGNLYFINTQLLTRTSTIARRHYMTVDELDEEARRVDPMMDLALPDAGGYDFFQTLKRTLEHEGTTLYLIIDEAHRGMKRRTSTTERNRSTIIQRLIQGDGDVPPVPIVWGISATPDRFNEYVAASSNFHALPEVNVDGRQVQDSGLLKDTIVLYIPEEEGNYDQELLAQGARRLKEMTSEWNAYVGKEELPEPVIPLMVVQVPDKAKDELIDDYITTVREVYPSLGVESFGHVFGDDRDIRAAGTVIPKVEAERVQELKRLRVLFAKEAISTGWDCPRAEVLVSFRPARDYTHVTQLMGRMVRTPLARRVEGNDVLGSVTCILPRFDREVATIVADRIARGGTDDTDGGETLRRVLIDEETVLPIKGDESSVEERLWECFESLPTETVPSGNADPIKQLFDLVTELSKDNLYPGAIKKTDETMFRAMEGAAMDYPEELAKAIEDVETVNLREIRTDLKTGATTSDATVRISASERSINVAMQEAERIFGPNLAKGFVKWQVAQQGAQNASLTSLFGALRVARIRTAALAQVPAAVDRVITRAAQLGQELRDKYRVEALSQNEARASVYRAIYEQSDTPTRMPLIRPTNWQVASSSALENIAGERSSVKPLKRYENHMMVWPVDGRFPAHFNEWEEEVLRVESKRPNFLRWFRNAGASDSSLNIAYPLDFDGTSASLVPFGRREQKLQWGRLRPDFIFFHEVDGEIRGSIVDPHGFHLADALPKLRGLARFVEAYPGEYHRVEAVAKVGENNYRVLDINDKAVRDQIRLAESAEALFRDSEVSRKYS